MADVDHHTRDSFSANGLAKKARVDFKGSVRSMNKKEQIEKATADAFIHLYNIKMGTSFFITSYSDAPDIRCEDSKGNIFNFEITLTEDRTRDIQYLEGGSNHRSINADDATGRTGRSLGMASCLQGNVTDMIINRIQKKLDKYYGPNVALVIRDASPVDWDWEFTLDNIRRSLESQTIPYDKGIWIINHSKDRIFRVV